VPRAGSAPRDGGRTGRRRITSRPGRRRCNHRPGGQDARALNLKSLAATCAACHGTDGKAHPEGATTPLAGLPRANLAGALREFRDGKRSATVMHQLAKGYTDEQIDAIAAYFAAQPK
jgi:sulfide dehydrogenase cytochrome subunit